MRAPGDCNPRPRHHDLQLRSRSIASEACAPRVGKIASLEVSPLGTPSSLATLLLSAVNGYVLRWLASGDRCGAGGRGFRGFTRFATEWSAARRKPIRAAAMHSSAANSADEQARRLPTSGRRKLPSGNFRSARDPEGAERVNPRKPRPPPPSLSPFARNRGMSPLPRVCRSQQSRKWRAPTAPPCAPRAPR